MHRTTPPLPQYVFMAWCLVKHRSSYVITMLCVCVCVSFQLVN